MSKPNHVWVVEWWNGKRWTWQTYGFTRVEAQDWLREYRQECPDDKFRVVKYAPTDTQAALRKGGK